MMEVTKDEILAARERLKEKFGQGRQQIGGKGTAQRKAKKVPRQSGTDERKVMQVMKRVGGSQLNDIDEVRMYREDGTSMAFEKPKIQASPQSNTYMITGSHVEKEVDVMPKILQQLSERGGQIDQEFLDKITEEMKQAGLVKDNPSEFATNHTDKNSPTIDTQTLVDALQQSAPKPEVPQDVVDFEAVANQVD